MYEWREYKEEADENIEACACEWKTLDICLLESVFSRTEMRTYTEYNQYQCLFDWLLVTKKMFFKII